MEWYPGTGVAVESQPMAIDEHAGYSEYYARRVPSHSYDQMHTHYPQERRGSVMSIRSVSMAPETPKTTIFRPFEDCLTEEPTSPPPRSLSSSYMRPTMAYPPTPSMKTSGSYIPSSSPAHRYAPYRNEHHSNMTGEGEWRKNSWYEHTTHPDLRAPVREEHVDTGYSSAPIAIPSGRMPATQPISIPERRESYDYSGSYSYDVEYQRSYSSSARGFYNHQQQPDLPQTPSAYSSAMCPPSFPAQSVPAYPTTHPYPTYPTPPPSRSPTGVPVNVQSHVSYHQQSTSPSQPQPYSIGTSVPARPVGDWDNTRAYSVSVPSHVAAAESSLLRKREMHNLLERKRRDGLRDCFASLAEVLPELEKEEGTNLPAKVAVLQAATDKLRELKEINSKYRAELETVREENVALRKRLSELQGSS
eukprot:comp21216_c0_seq1/m.28855 comp21216_c0_seq1/g.28855  ORF comp21216_c0_seq1/g.28855 comp21216_c0_seq1/m.28855 type:complete len:418 (-) comp21216_c0_seq1:522-1775(-)